MDKWDERQLAFMQVDLTFCLRRCHAMLILTSRIQAGGNKACKAFLKEQDCFDLPLAQRWASKGAEKWRQKLKKEVDGLAKKKKKKVETTSESESETETETESEEEEVVKKPPIKMVSRKPVPSAKPVKKAAAPKTADLIDLMDFGPPE
eukprot:1273598-Rhodomonas_salina.2